MQAERHRILRQVLTWLVKENSYEFSHQEIPVLLQTLSGIVLCRYGMCIYCIGNDTDTAIVHKIHHQKYIGRKYADPLDQIYIIGAVMLILLLIHIACTMFVDYQGHMMGAMMESDMRRELFEHYQKLSFSFYDEQKTGQLMTRIANDSFALAELYHHGPEDIAIVVVEVSSGRS